MTSYHTLNTFNNPFRHYRVIDIVPFQEKIAVLQFASADVSKKMVKNGVYVDHYILVDIFPEDFTSQKRLSFSFEEDQPCYRSDAYYYREGEQLFILIEYYKLDNIFVTNKVFEITENEVIEQSFCCIPQKRIFNDAKVYSFGDKEVFMQSPFMMSCRDKQNQKTLWKYKLSAYLYTQVEEYNDILYFGTAGKGGYFYGVSLNNGQTVFSYNTGQTVHFVRSGEGVVSISTFEGGKAESIEIEITNESPVAGKQLKDIRLPGKALVGVILRENEAIVPRGNTQILDGDHIVLFTLPESVSKLLKYLT